MKKFTGILIVSDVDGTYLSKSALTKNIEAIERFKEQGGLFTFATGRDFPALLEVIPDAANIANAPIIVANGAQIYDFARDKYIYDCPVADKALLIDIIKRVLKKYPETGVRFSCEHNMIVPELCDMLRRDLEGYSLEKLGVTEMPMDELVGSDIKIYKVVLVDRDTAENLEGIRAICKEFDKNGELYFAKSYWCGLEVVNVNGSKGQAALQLKDYVSAQTLYAIGDYENDIEMLKVADISASPENALDEVKRFAKIITSHCDDGAVADLIGIIEREYI